MATRCAMTLGGPPRAVASTSTCRPPNRDRVVGVGSGGKTEIDPTKSVRLDAHRLLCRGPSRTGGSDALRGLLPRRNVVLRGQRHQFIARSGTIARGTAGPDARPMISPAEGARALAQDAPAVTLPGTHVLDFVSALDGDRYRLQVSLPQGYAADDTTRYPVLYVLDGHYFFPAAYAAQLTLDERGDRKGHHRCHRDVEHSIPSWTSNRQWDYLIPGARRPTPPSPYAIGCPGIACARRRPRLRPGSPVLISPLVERTFRPRTTGAFRLVVRRALRRHRALGVPRPVSAVGMSSPSLGWMNESCSAWSRPLPGAHRAARARLSLRRSKEGQCLPVARFADSLRSRAMRASASSMWRSTTSRTGR